MKDLTTLDVFSLISSITSIVLAVVSLWLSLYFYKQSAKTNKDSERISNDIKTSVDKLEGLFNKLYSDTFTMLKDQSNLMQKHFINSTTSVASNNPSVPIEPEHAILAKIVEHRKLTIDTLCKQCTAIDRSKVEQIITTLRDKGSISFDGDLIIFIVASGNAEQSSSANPPQ